MAARIMTGIVVSDSQDKTIMVRVDRSQRHPLYDKAYVRSKKYAAHDEKNSAHLGDRVEIIESRPISKSKTWRLKEIVERSEGSDLLVGVEVEELKVEKKAPKQPAKSKKDEAKESTEANS